MEHLSPCTNGNFAASADIERLYERVRLVNGKGRRRDGRLCIMTFVALLAGERHTDAPATASLVVRQFAIALNDGMLDDERQRLKPFAPRIVGTRDALDEERAELLLTALREEIGPQLRRDLIESTGQRHVGRDLAAYGAGFTDAVRHLRGDCVDDLCNETGRLSPQRIGAEVAKLLVRCALEAAPPASRSWYWTKGVDLLDRLCDVGNYDCGIAVGIDQLARAESALGGNSRLDEFSQLIASAIGELKHRFRYAPPEPGGSQGRPTSALRAGVHLH